MDVVAVERLVKDQERDIANGAQVDELGHLARLNERVHEVASILRHSHSVYHDSCHEEEEHEVAGRLGVFRRQVGVMGHPVSEPETLHDDCVGDQSEFCVDVAINLQLVELIDQEDVAPCIHIDLRPLTSFTSLMVSLDMELGSLPIDHVQLDGALLEVDFEKHDEKLGASNKSE